MITTNGIIIEMTGVTVPSAGLARNSAVSN